MSLSMSISGINVASLCVASISGINVASLCVASISGISVASLCVASTCPNKGKQKKSVYSMQGSRTELTTETNNLN